MSEFYKQRMVENLHKLKTQGLTPDLYEKLYSDVWAYGQERFCAGVMSREAGNVSRDKVQRGYGRQEAAQHILQKLVAGLDLSVEVTSE